MNSASETAQQLVRKLLTLGVTDVALSPGSRSGPVARALVAADVAGLIRLHVRVDEREAGFLAVGMAKAAGRLTPVVTTSGTAVANLHPAMLEALHANVPVLAVTADRPARLRGTGANQTTDQRSIFPRVPFIQRVEDIEGGIAHLNLELDEPLTETDEWDFGGLAIPGEWDSQPANEATPSVLPGGPLSVVVAGDGAGPSARVVADAGQWPLIAEPTSGARTGQALNSGRFLLEHSPLAERIERVVSFGHATLARSVVRLLSSDVEIVHVGTQATFPVAAGDNVSFVEAVEPERPGDSGWFDRWQEADAKASKAITALDDDRLTAARAVWNAVPPGGLLWLGSSNPIRDVDLVAAPFPVGERRKVLANRGLAGIDGTLSSAIGAALVRQGPAVAYVGDLTFLHGSNGLLIGPDEPRTDLTIVVGNDDGGGIFAGLEQGAPEFADGFERVFGTPTGADLGSLCAAFGVAHSQSSARDLPAVLAGQSGGIRVVEVELDRRDRRDFADRIAAAARRALLG